MDSVAAARPSPPPETTHFGRSRPPARSAASSHPRELRSTPDRGGEEAARPRDGSRESPSCAGGRVEEGGQASRGEACVRAVAVRRPTRCVLCEEVLSWHGQAGSKRGRCACCSFSSPCLFQVALSLVHAAPSFEKATGRILTSLSVDFQAPPGRRTRRDEDPAWSIRSVRGHDGGQLKTSARESRLVLRLSSRLLLRWRTTPRPPIGLPLARTSLPSFPSSP